MLRLSLAVVPALALALAACTSFHPGTFEAPDAADAQPDAHIAVSRALAASGDYGSPGVGVLSRLDVDGLSVTTNVTPGSALGDPIIRQYGDRVYVINRFGSNSITVLDARTLALVSQISTGNDSNPQDVAPVGNTLYVPALGSAGVLVIANDAVQTTIDLSTTLGDPDGKPDCESAYAVGTYVYVACGLLANFSPVRNAKIAVIDTTTNTVVGTSMLPERNPLGLFARAPANSVYGPDLLIPTAPTFTLTDGCVARVSTTFPTTPTTSCGPSNSTLGGLPNKLAFDAVGMKLYVAVTENFSPAAARIHVIDAHTGIATTSLSSTTQEVLDVAVCPNGDVVGMDHKTNAGGLRVWRASVERTTSPLAIGMPPNVNPTLVCYDAAP